MSRGLGVVGLAALALAWLGCWTPAPAPRPPAEPEALPGDDGGGSLTHVVARGETLWRISQKYGTSVEALSRANGLADPTAISAGQRLRIPNGRVRAATGSRAWTAIDPRGRAGSVRFAWPIDGRVSSSFGYRERAHHDGIDILAPQGTPIRAAESGRVVHSDDSLSGYGNMIILKHSGKYSTVYAHNRRNLVREGDFVEQGQVIGEVGRTGRASTPHLHFELRESGSAVDPLRYLP